MSKRGLTVLNAMIIVVVIIGAVSILSLLSSLSGVEDLSGNVIYSSIYVTSNPSGATAYTKKTSQSDQDYVNKGTTSLTIQNLESGVSYTLKLVKTGYQTHYKTFTAGSLLSYNAVLTSSGGTGTLKVSSTPTGANVYVDGVLKGVTPSSGYLSVTLSAEVHTLQVTKTGYIDAITGISITSGGTITKTVAFTPGVN